MNTTRPKQHHYVPRFYLERFVDHDGHLWTFDKLTDKVFGASPSKLARESGFYEAPALGNEIDQTAMEGMLSELESEASAIIARWLEAIKDVPPGTAVIEAADRPTMSQYLPDGLAWSPAGFETVVTCRAFSYLRGISSMAEGVASPPPASWNQIVSWLRQIEALRDAARALVHRLRRPTVAA